MPRSFRSRWRLGMLGGVMLAAAACSTVRKCDTPDGVCDADAPQHGEPILGKDNSMMAMARDLDHLEKHIDWYGSATAKAPDIWGQARLTKYREEIEKELAGELSNFKTYISGSTARADQSYAVAALSLGAAINGAPTAPTAVAASGLVNPVGFGNALTAVQTFTPAAQFQTGIGLEPVEYLNQKNRYLNHLSQLRRNNEGDDTADSPGYSLNLMRIPVSVLPGKRTDTGHGAEVTMTINPILGDELLPATFRNLVTAGLTKELGFPLTKILDGKGNEYLDNDLVRLIVRHRRAIDNVYQTIATSKSQSVDELFRLMDTELNKLPRLLANALKLTDEQRVALRVAYQNVKLQAKYDPGSLPSVVVQMKGRTAQQSASMLSAELLSLDGPSSEILRNLVFDVVLDTPQIVRANAAFANILATLGEDPKDNSRKPNKVSEQTRPRRLSPPLDEGFSPFTPAPGIPLPTPPATSGTLPPPLPSGSIPLSGSITPDEVKQITELAKAALDAAKSIGVPFSSGTRSRQSMPFSQYIEVYGEDFVFEIMFQSRKALKQSIAAHGYAHLADVQSFLELELDAARRFLRLDESRHFWTNYCTPETVRLVRTRSIPALEVFRLNFTTDFEGASGSVGADPNHPDTQKQYSSTAALAWMILVHSALLNDRLILDMKETASHKQTALGGGCDWPDFYLPEPSQESRCKFNDYVRLRWPVKVFALDPANDEQNLTDSLSTRRETQLALAVAFAGGNINGNTYNKFARKLDADYQTIDLNRTQVGFGHGENVFGWRFYPRFQTPDTKSNLSVLFRDQLVGGPNKNRLIHDRRLEPGMRECTALVIMPSFVPYMNLEVTTNWFGLTNPKHKVLDHTQSLRLSQRVKAISVEGPAVADACRYRDGDQNRLLERAKQLEARLPMQTLGAQVPIEENLGGFELFVHGTTDFAPELYGFYGAPGIEPGKDGVTLFLVGNHFSVTQSRVIIGNAEVPKEDVKMISRQVMQVKVPKAAIAYEPPAETKSPTPEEKNAADAKAQQAIADAKLPAFTWKQNDQSTSTTTKVTDAATAGGKINTKVVHESTLVTATSPPEKPAAPKPAQGRLFINVHVATPYGVTRELAVPVKAGAKLADATGSAPAALKNDLTVTYSKLPKGEGRVNIVVNPVKAGQSLEVKWPETSGKAPDLVTAKLTFTVNGCPLAVDVVTNPLVSPGVSVLLASKGGVYTLADSQLNNVNTFLNAHLCGGMAAPLLFTDDTNPFKASDFAVKVVLTDANDPKKSADVEKPLAWKFTCMIP